MGSTYPEDAPELKPTLDLQRNPPGQSEHPDFAAKAQTSFLEPGRSHVRISDYQRRGRVVQGHYRHQPVKPDVNEAAHYAPPTNPNERDTLPGGKGSI